MKAQGGENERAPPLTNFALGIFYLRGPPLVADPPARNEEKGDLGGPHRIARIPESETVHKGVLEGSAETRKQGRAFSDENTPKGAVVEKHRNKTRPICFSGQSKCRKGVEWGGVNGLLRRNLAGQGAYRPS